MGKQDNIKGIWLEKPAGIDQPSVILAGWMLTARGKKSILAALDR